MKRNKKAGLHLVLCVIAALAVIISMAAMTFAANGNAAVNEARNGVVRVEVAYEGPDGNDYAIQVGSGFLINDLTVMTNHHVIYVDDAYVQAIREFFGADLQGKSDKQIREKIKYKITIYQDSSVEATVDTNAVSQNGDYAVLKLKSALNDYTPLTIRDSSDVEATEPCNALGFPGKMTALKAFPKFDRDSVDVTPGQVKSKSLIDGTGVMTIYMTGVVSPGSSGGPLVDNDGNVIGIVWGGDESLTCSTASEEFLKVLNTLGVDYTLAGEKKDDTEKDDEEKIVEPPTQTQPKEEPKKSMLPFIIGGIAALLVIIVIVVLLVTRGKKKNDAPAAANTYTGAAPIPAVPQTGTGAPAPAAPKVPPAYTPRPDTGVLNQGSDETTVLGQGADETTVLSGNQAKGSLTRTKTGEKISVTRDNFKIGRERSKVDYCISDNTAIGRHHATIVNRNGAAYLVDQNSRNFTFINDVKVEPNKEEKLKDGDKITFGDESFTYND